MYALRGRRSGLLAFVMVTMIFMLLVMERSSTRAQEYFDYYLDGEKKQAETGLPKLRYIPTPPWVPPPVKDPFPLLGLSTPPPVPAWNRPAEGLHLRYGLDYAPPLLIGFTRTWPLLIQAVVSYITAGWPPESIYVIENTGAQRANARRQLTLQNPFYLNHDHLRKLGVNVVSTPVLMNFAQLQNFYIHMSHEHDWPYYFWSHMDVLALSYERGNEHTPAATDPGYKTIYELCLAEMRRALDSGDRWANRFFAYDHLALVNREAYEDVGGFDTFIPFYTSDCDMHSRLLMHNWTQHDARAGDIHDVNAVLDDLSVLYRQPGVEPTWTDPNPPAPRDNEARDLELNRAQGTPSEPENLAEPERYWHKLKTAVDRMGDYKKRPQGRNTWQGGQRGGQGEPYYYPARGVEEAVDVLTEAGREVYRRKWGHRDCDLLTGTRLKLEDQWKTLPDWV